MAMYQFTRAKQLKFNRGIELLFFRVGWPNASRICGVM